MPAFRYEFSVESKAIVLFRVSLDKAGERKRETPLLQQRVTASFDANDRLSRFEPISPLRVSSRRAAHRERVFIFIFILAMPTVHRLCHARVLWQMLVQRVSKDKWTRIATNPVAKQSFIADKRAVYFCGLPD